MPANSSRLAGVRRRIIVEHDPVAGQWTAWFDDVPCGAFGGATSSEAIIRLMETLPHPDR